MALVKYNNNSISAITTAGTLATGAMVLIKSQTASSSATIDFLNGTSDVVFDGTYPIYKFSFINMHPATDNVKWTFQVDTGTNPRYNQTITSTDFISQHSENDSATEAGYASANDQEQGTSFQPIGQLVGNGNDECVSGSMLIFAPSNTTFVKHFAANTNVYRQDDYTREHFTGGYVNTTTALTRVRFKFDSGNIDAGTIKLYGLKDS